MKKEIEKSSLLNRWKNRVQKNNGSNTIIKAPKEINIPLSHGQKRLWFLQQLYPENAFYNYAETYTFNGELNTDILIESLKRVYKDHDILRTTYHIENGEIFQRINNNTDIEISEHDLSTLSKEDAHLRSQKLIEINASKHFDLTISPLIRVALIKINSATNILQITLHHIVTDKWSMGKFREDLAGYYRELNLKEVVTERRETIQYTDYAFWQNKNDIDTNGLKYWKNKLSGELPFLNLPLDFNRPLQPTFKGAASFTQIYSEAISSKLLSLSKELETTPYVLLLSVYYVFLHRYSGQTDILVGSPVTNRDQKVLESLIGFFNETIILRTNISKETSFKTLVQEVRKNTVEAFENKNIPFDILVKELKVKRSLAINPFFQVMFLYHAVPENPFFDTDVSLTHTWHDLKVSKFDLTLYIAEENGILSSTFEYASDLFHESTANRFQDYFKSLLEGIVLNPNQSISEIPMLTSEEKNISLKDRSSNHNAFESYKAIHHIIEDQARKYPSAIAVTFDDTSLTYKELNERANLLAHVILSKKDADDTVIGLAIERSTTMIVGLLAILKAGCAYLPIDPEYPSQRIDFILKDANVNCIITQDHLFSIFSDFNTKLISVDTIEKAEVRELPKVSNSDLAYIIYTSGSTGNPKGVPITHKNIINSTAGRLDFYDTNPTAFLLMSSISFDSSKAGIFWTLCTGGNLVISEKRLEQDIDRIASIIATNKISHTLMLPSLYKVILEHAETNKFNSLTTVMVAGETCTVSLVEKHFSTLPNVDLYNEYGPTEATVWCIAHKITTNDIDSGTIPIGNNVSNAIVKILDSKLRPVPFGSVGDLYIGGTSLAGYYINRPDLTESAYVKDKNDMTLYKTGDLAKYNSGGHIEFLGRADQQVKIRGYRIELDEVENTLNTNSMIRQAVVVVEATDQNTQAIDMDSEIESSELAELLTTNLNTPDIENLLSSIKSLDVKEKEYLLNQIR